MRSSKVGIARSPDKNDKPAIRKMSTTSRGTIQSTQSQLCDVPDSTFSRKELKEYRQLFNMFDTDGSGAIGNDELKQAMLSIGIHANEAEIDNVIKEVDADGNGEIDFEEFCACMKKSQNIIKSTNEELIRECFDIFDQDHNGIITESEFKYIAKEFGDFTEELAERVFRELDVSANGHLSADQFATIVEDYLLSDSSNSSKLEHGEE
ncbi:EF hand [Oesophagostomum dentatum]|uniref:EF hand n=1 Tax=Oesophagostomum dentatum TaxID=61180 RepID=A0A0B1TQV3_OESDE|nr:EF hand [Oesophagostomum dentatum]